MSQPPDPADLDVSPKSLARNPATTAEQLQALRTVYDPELDRLLARHPQAPAGLLEDLSHSADRATRRQVARHPAAAKDVLLKLAPQFPMDFLSNPVVDWLLIEEPDLLQTLGQGVLKNALKNAKCPEALMAWAVRHGSLEQQLALTMNPAASAQVLEALTTVKGSVGQAARAHIRSPQSETTLMGTANVFVGEVEAGLAALDPGQALSFWRRDLIGPAQWLHLSAESRAAVIGLPASQRAGHEPDCSGCRAQARSIRSADDLLAFLSKHPDIGVRKAVASNPFTPAKVLEGLSQDSYESVRWAVASNEATPAMVLETLATNSSVRGAVASNIATPAAVLSNLAKDTDSWVRRAVASNEAAPGTVLADLAMHSDSWVREAVASNKSTPEAVLEALAKDKDDSVLQAVGSNEATPVPVLENLAKYQGDSWRVFEALAGNPSSPACLLEMLAKGVKRDGSSWMRELSARRLREVVARNPSTPSALLEELANDSSSVVRQGVATNEATSAKVLAALAKAGLVTGINYLAQGRAAKRRRVQSTACLARSTASERAARWTSVASDPSAAPLVLAKLAGRRSVAVSWAVAGNPNTPAEARRELTLSLWLSLGLEALPPPALSVVEELRPHVRLIMDARHWWHKMKLLAARHGYPRLPARLTDQQLVARFRHEMACFSEAPQQSLAAEVMRVSRRPALFLKADLIGKALKAPLCTDLEDTRRLTGVPRLFALAHANTPVDALVKAYRSTEWLERTAVARNINAPPKLLVALKKDANRFVAKQAAETELLQSEMQQWPALAPKLPDQWQVSLVGLAQGALQWDGFAGETPDLLDQLRHHHKAVAQMAVETRRPAASLERVAAEIALRLHDGFVEWMWRDPVWGDLIKLDDLFQLSLESRAWLGQHERQRLWELGAAPARAAVRTWIEDEAVNIRRRMAGDPTTPDDVLAALAKDQSSTVREMVAQNPNASAAALEALSIDTDNKVRWCVAQNPKASITTVLQSLAKDQLSDVRRSVAMNPIASPDLADDVLAALARHQVSTVRQMIAKNPNTSAAVLEALSIDADSAVRSCVAENPNASLTALQSLAKDDDRGIRRSVAMNPNASPSLLDELRGPPFLAAQIANHPSARPELLAELAKSWDKDVRFAVAQNPSAPASALRDLANDPHPTVCQAMAARLDTPVDALHLLLQHESLWVRLKVAGRKALPQRLMEQLARDKSADVRLALAGNPEAPPELVQVLMKALARDRDPGVRKKVIQHPASGDDLLEMLANDDDRSVRLYATGRRWQAERARTIDGNPTAGRLNTVVGRLVDREALKLAGQPVPVPAWGVDHIARGLDGLHLIALRPSVRSLNQAARSKDWLTRLAAALHPQATPAQQALLEKDEVPEVVAAVMAWRTGGLDAAKDGKRANKRPRTSSAGDEGRELSAGSVGVTG